MTRRLLLALPVLFLAAAFAEARPDDEHPAVTLVKSKVKDPTKPFALVVTIKVKAGKEADLEKTFAPCLAATRKEPGCIAYELNRDTEDPSTYIMFEKFRSIAALEAHLKEKHTIELLKAVPALADLKIKVYTVPE